MTSFNPDPTTPEPGTSAPPASNPSETSSTPPDNQWSTQDTDPSPIDNLYEEIAMIVLPTVIAGILLALLLAS